MEELKKKRKRIARPKKFKSGDVFWADSANGWHLTIILEDHTIDNHQECIPVCNFTGTPNEFLNYVIPIGGYKLPKKYWTREGQQKPENWIVCQHKDCIKAMNYDVEIVVGNIKEDCPEIFDLICEKTKECLISSRLNNLCDCDGKDSIVIDDANCECENIPNN